MLYWTEITVNGGLVLKLVATDAGIRAIEFPPPRPLDAQRDDTHPLMRELALQLQAYFAGDRSRHDRHTLPKAGLGSSGDHPVRRDAQLYAGSEGHRRGEGRPRGRSGQRLEPGADRGALPSRHWQQRQTGG